jgi:3-hydroxybutyryl-CoA dehydrogenase
MHFFNPVPVLKLVEIVRGRDTSDDTTRSIVELAKELGKVPAEANDFPGFVSNRILMPFINEAVWALNDGVAEADAIDTIAKLGFAHPIGPLALADLIGLDTCVAIMGVLQEGLGDDRYAPCPLLTDYVAQGRLGRKTHRGFFEY